MAPLKFTKVVGFSSEDPQFPASNLLAKGKWKCRDEGEKQAWVCLQLEELSTITNIDIGNNGAAFVEIQVGRHGCDQDQMKVLLVASSFMSVNEARVGDNVARVRMFTKDKLSAEVAREKWDIVKVTATQPFNKHSKYGVSFVSLTGPSKSQPKSDSESPVLKLGAFRLMDANEESISVGSFFARKKENKGNDSGDAAVSALIPSVAVSMKSETSLAEMTLNATKKEEKKRKLEITTSAKKELKKRRVERDFPSRLILPGETESGSPTQSQTNPSLSRENQNINEAVFKNAINVRKENISTPHRSAKKENPYVQKKEYLKFNEFLKGVNFSISGFQNPLRGEIRQKALDMGARYHGDWNSSCTHLVCAFTNTPKFNQVKGKGKIVKKDWIEQCHSNRKRLPWRRFCLDKDDKNKEESEDEIIEQVAETESNDCDTDEEIERIQSEENRKKEIIENTGVEIQRLGEQEEFLKEDTNNSKLKEITDKYECETDDEIDNKILSPVDSYDAETDIDEEEVARLLPNISHLAYDKLPNFFRGKNFYVDDNFTASARNLLIRYITACEGNVSRTLPSLNLDFVIISERNKRPEDFKLGDLKTKFVKPSWVFACKDVEELVDPSKYLVT